MPSKTEERRDPFKGLESGEPAEDLGLTSPTPSALTRRPKNGGRETPVRPAEKRRRARQLTVTFSDEDIPQRLRVLAEQWGMVAPDGRSPRVSALVEYLLLPRLEAAEAGEIDPPEE